MTFSFLFSKPFNVLFMIDFDSSDGDSSAKSQHMVRGTWLSKSNGSGTYGLPHKLVAHLRNALSSGDLMDSASDVSVLYTMICMFENMGSIKLMQYFS